MRRAIASSLLSLLLVTTLVWGGCVSCEQYFMWPGAKGCCGSDGRCKTRKAPAKQEPSRECKQIAFDQQKSAAHHVALPVAAVVTIHDTLPLVQAFPLHRGAEAAGPSPPDLQILHSTFLI